VGADPGESGLTIPRLFLVAPDGIAAARLVECLTAACAAGDVASLVIPAAVARDCTSPAQALGVAVILRGGEARDVARAGADGLQLDCAADDLAEARRSLGKDRILGAYAGASRHLAMEAAEAGADYIAFDQTGPSLGGEPIVRWWADMMEIPAVAYQPAEAPGLDILLPQKPDFIRPSDTMWQDAESARRVVTELSQRLGKT
jgi:thiamine-phosphate pyrophosphorylase